MNKGVDISVLVVSYNCRMVLSTMLTSLRKAMATVEAEVLVADNLSTDGTLTMLAERFPWVRAIDCGANLGFGKANNLLLQKASGRVILLLNPDTLVPATLLSDLLLHFDQHPMSGAVGVRMIDGDGLFARESKRGRMTPSSTFFKITGLWRLSPRSEKIAGYYAGHVGDTDTAAVPVLSGACMAFKREMYAQNGGFDSKYFMYGEDIDLSMRYNDASQGNIYRGDLAIVHFKGESTPPKLRYIGHFYNAMLIFSRKHEFPNHNFLANACVLCGIGMAYCTGVLRCLLTRLKKGAPFVYPQSITLVTDNAASASLFEQKVKAKVSTIAFSQLSALDLTAVETLVFDIESHTSAVIDYLQSHTDQAHFGFFSAEAQAAFVYHMKSCKPIF